MFMMFNNVDVVFATYLSITQGAYVHTLQIAILHIGVTYLLCSIGKNFPGGIGG